MISEAKEGVRFDAKKIADFFKEFMEETEQITEGKQHIFVFFHNQNRDFAWGMCPEEFNVCHEKLIAATKLQHSSVFRDVWQSSLGHRYELRYHRYFSDDNHSINSMMMQISFGKRSIPAQFIYVEMVPIEEAEQYDKLEAQYKIKCAGPECMASGLCLTCSRCKKVRYCSEKCQRNDWKQKHKQECEVV